MTEIAHFIDNERVAGRSRRNQPVFNPATGDSDRTLALRLRRGDLGRAWQDP